MKDTGRARYCSASDEQALAAFKLVTKLEPSVKPSLEPAHCLHEVIRLAPKLNQDEIIIYNNCGHAYKDQKIIKERLDIFHHDE